MTLNISPAQYKTLTAIRETLLLFSDLKEDAEMVIKKGVATTLMVAFEVEGGVYQYEVNKSGAIIKMAKVARLGGLCLREFNLSK